MRVACLGADEESVHAIKIARQLGHTVIAVDKNPFAPGLKEADVQLIIDLGDEEKVIEALKEEKIDLVLTVPIGRHITTVGAVNEALQLPGIGKACAEYCADKYAFHNRLRNVKLRTGHCYLVNERNIFNPDNINYPAVFKPRYGSHSMSVHMVMGPEELRDLEIEIWGTGEDTSDSNVKSDQPVAPGQAGKTDESGNQGQSDKPKEDVTAFMARLKKAMEDRVKVVDKQNTPDVEYILEDEIVGAEYAADGVVEGCNFELLMIRRKILTAPPARQAVAFISAKLDEEHRIANIIKTYMARICEAIGLKDCMVHADLSIMGRKCMAIEVSASPAGHHIYDEFIPMATGVDICSQYLTYMTGEAHTFSPLKNLKLMLHYFNMENCFVHRIPTPDQVREILPEKVKLKKWECNIKLLDYLGTISDENSLLGRGYYILEGPSDDILIKAADLIMNEFELK